MTCWVCGGAGDIECTEGCEGDLDCSMCRGTNYELCYNCDGDGDVADDEDE